MSTSDSCYNTGYILRICAIAALGGILFGYDTAVISGAIGSLTSYFHLSPAGRFPALWWGALLVRLAPDIYPNVLDARNH